MGRLTALSSLSGAGMLDGALDAEFVGHPGDTLRLVAPSEATHIVLEARGMSGGPATSGIRILGLPGGESRLQPRSEFSRTAFGPIAGPVRLEFVGSHELRSVQALVQEEATTRALVLLSSAHSRDGAVDMAEAVELLSGDRLDVTWEDAAVAPDLARSYFLEVTGARNSSSGVAPARHTPVEGPVRFALGAPRPNPLDRSTTIGFDVSVRTRVRLELYDLAGRRVATLVDRHIEPGSHTVAWDGATASGRRASAGVYFLRMRAADFTGDRRLVVVP